VKTPRAGSQDVLAQDVLAWARREFGRQAATFETAPTIAARPAIDALVALLGDLAGRRALDIACGPGLITAAAAALAAEMVGLDVSPEMLARARRRCNAAGVDNVQFVAADAAALPFAGASFDAVVTRLSVHHFADPQAVLGEAFRVLRPGGVLALSDVVASDDRQAADVHNAIEQLRDPSHVRMLPANALLRCVEAAGLVIAEHNRWQVRRELDEWLDIVADEERIRPLRALIAALARRGETAGIGLEAAGDTVTFVHSWIAIKALKPV